MNSNQVTAIHLYNLAHGVNGNPLSKQYSLSFEQFINLKSINLPPQLDDKFCNNCGQPNIPGLTTRSRIVYGKKKRGFKTTCLVCKGKNVDYSISQQRVKVEDIKPFVAEWPQNKPKIDDNTTNVNKETNKSKERKKKRKQNNLANLLDIKKKQKASEAKRLGSLNLMEFMK